MVVVVGAAGVCHDFFVVDPLRLAPVPLSQWRAYHEGRLAGEVVSTDPVLSRWKRVRGVDAEGMSHPDGVADHDLGDRRARLDALLAATAHDRACEELATRSLAVIVADADGVIVDARFTGYGRRAIEARLVPGAKWGEGTRGTNAIGTALEEARAIAVVGSAHFERANHALFCYASPIFDPYGNVAGVFDVTGDLADDDPRLAATVRAVGAKLTEALRAGAYALALGGGARVVERLVQRCASPALLVEARGVRHANDGATGLLGIPAQGAVSVERVFGVSFDLLAQQALGAGDDLVFEVRGERFRLELEPIGDRARVLAVVVHFDRLAPPRANASPSTSSAFDTIHGTDPTVATAKRLASRFAVTDLPVLLLAETGTGKDLMARAVHAASGRRGPFVPLNCGALSPQLLESELFGFGPGSFTGARASGQEGKIAAAEGGTLFLDEIGEMSPGLQALLLRVLEDGSYSRIGETNIRHADFRLVCATCRDLPKMVEEGTFRRDLFYRIHGATITLPPVRERKDRAELARTILETLAREAGVPCPPIGPSALAHVEGHDWPGNVRELKAALRHALALHDGTALAVEHFPPVVLRRSSPPKVRSAREAEAEALDAALAASQGNLSEAARALGVSRSKLYRMMRRAER